MNSDRTNLSDPTRAETILLSLSEKLALTASAKSVYGEPIQAYDRTLVPVAAFGFASAQPREAAMARTLGAAQRRGRSGRKACRLS